jgi:hypothetical protein
VVEHLQVAVVGLEEVEVLPQWAWEVEGGFHPLEKK